MTKWLEKIGEHRCIMQAISKWISEWVEWKERGYRTLLTEDNEYLEVVEM